MIIYFTCHGQTIWNKKGIIQGHKDSSLTQKGIKSAEKKAKLLNKKGVEIIYSSDLGRCAKTAEIINQWLEVKIVFTKKLRERDFGKFNGKVYEKIKEKIDLSNLNEKAPGGESLNQLRKRVISFIQSFFTKKFKKILLVTHGGPARTILINYCQTDFKSKKIEVSQDAVYSLEQKGKEYKLKKVPR
ncbi:MAG: histidine phosphatase family protein [Candidatus Pacebacteria bacterium]|nr:histidine phosphatase family protein [Candidatus Paceibacterota bacterium]